MAEKGRARKGQKDSAIGGQFGWHLVEMLESPAWRVLSRAAHLVLSRLEVELGHHGGKENGKLPTTFDHFEEYGVHRRSIAPAIREVVALGFVEITQEGRAGNAAWRRPTLYRLTYRYTDSTKPTDDWRKIETLKQANAIASAARDEKTENQWQKVHHKSVRKPHHNPDFCSVETATTVCSAETATTSISRGQGVGGRAGARRPTKQASASGPIAQDLEQIGSFSSALLNSRLVKSGRRS